MSKLGESKTRLRPELRKSTGPNIRRGKLKVLCCRETLSEYLIRALAPSARICKRCKEEILNSFIEEWQSPENARHCRPVLGISEQGQEVEGVRCETKTGEKKRFVDSEGDDDDDGESEDCDSDDGFFARG